MNLTFFAFVKIAVFIRKNGIFLFLKKVSQTVLYFWSVGYETSVCYMKNGSCVKFTVLCTDEILMLTTGHLEQNASQ